MYKKLSFNLGFTTINDKSNRNFSVELHFEYIDTNISVLKFK